MVDAGGTPLKMQMNATKVPLTTSLHMHMVKKEKQVQHHVRACREHNFLNPAYIQSEIYDMPILHC